MASRKAAVAAEAVKAELAAKPEAAAEAKAPMKILQIATREPDRYRVYDLKTGKLAKWDEGQDTWVAIHTGAVLMNVGDVKTFSPLTVREEAKNGNEE